MYIYIYIKAKTCLSFQSRDFPGGPVVRTANPSFDYWGFGSAPGRRTKILKVPQSGQNQSKPVSVK